MTKRIPGPWEMKRAPGFATELYTVSRIEGRTRVHLQRASDGSPMLWGKEQAEAAITKQRTPK